jgi:chromosomal replication initiator protein
MNNEIFSKVLDSLRTKVSDFNYKNWFQNMNWHLDEPNKVTFKVPSKFIRDWLQDHYLELIKFELFRHTETEYNIGFKVDRQVTKNLELFPDPKVLDANPVVAIDNFIKTGQATKKVSPKKVEKTPGSALGFNPNYTFDNFVVGNSNQLVNAACKAVALQPAKSYNPLFIYGGVGLGKTHLVNSIGLEILKQYPSWKVVYVTGEHFTNEVINAIRYDKTFDLRKKYRESCDVLLIDDIQFIAGKERTMEEFFHTFNALYEARKQIILTSDKLPKDIQGLEERLRSRFSWGLLADIQSPDLETRIAILQRKAEREGIAVPADVCEYIAQNVATNVRDLEGALIRVFAFASLSKVRVDLELTREVLQNIVATTRPKLTIEAIQNKVCDFYNLRVADLKSKRRHKNLAVPRQIAMYLCKKYVGSSFPEIGNKFGGKDHTTVMHAVSKIGKCVTSDEIIRSEVTELEKLLGI